MIPKNINICKGAINGATSIVTSFLFMIMKSLQVL
jgi:hypothetical protein